MDPLRIAASHKVLTAFGVEGVATVIASEVDEIFRVDTGRDRLLLRVSASGDAEFPFQVAVLEHLAARAPDLPVPRVIRTPYGAALPRLRGPCGWTTAMLTTFLPGEPLSARRGVPAPVVIDALARLDAALRGFRHPDAERVIAWDVSRADTASSRLAHVASKKLADLCRSALETFAREIAPRLAALRRQIIHNDFNPSNLLASPNGHITGILDFGDALNAPLIGDLATATAYLPAPDGFEALLVSSARTYNVRVPLTTAELELLPDLVAARAALVVLNGSSNAHGRPENAPYLLRNLPRASAILRIWASHDRANLRKQLISIAGAAS